MSNRLDQEREERLQPQRMESCQEELERLGYTVTSDNYSTLKFEYNGNTITLWPYSGWFSGKGVQQGRGFVKLLRQIGSQKETK